MTGSGNFEFVSLIVLSLLDFAWIISELLAVKGVNDSNDAIVFGHIRDKLGQGYLYFPSICCVLYFLTRIIPHALTRTTQITYAETPVLISAMSAAGVVLFEVPEAVLVYLVVLCRNKYLQKVQVASRLLHIIAVAARVLFTATINMKLFRLRKSSTSRYTIWSFVLSLVYFAGAACVLGLSLKSLQGYKLINNYDPHISDTSIIFTRPGMMPSTPVSDFPIGKTLSRYGTSTDHYVVLASLRDLTTSQAVHTWTEGSGKSSRTVQGHFLKASLDCKNLPSVFRPTQCSESVYFNLRYALYDSSPSIYGKLSFNCGLRKNGVCREGCRPSEEGWTLRLVNIVTSNTTGSLVTTPWQQVASCGEPPVKLDEKMSACRGRSIAASSVVLVSCGVALWVLGPR